MDTVYYTLVLLALFGACHSQWVVDTEYGQVEGHLIADVYNGEYTADVYSFKGVPYGNDTGGQNRFALPKKRDPWAPSVLVADRYGEQCPQSLGLNIGEDCLNVNIYTPITAGPHPVMVWFHGGAYTSGSNRMYPGHTMATRNVVMVTVNYRLGHFGFAYTASPAAPGNMGLHDQNLALEFVQNNIANFNGDPNKVTIFGQSAGASSASLLMVSPLAQGRMHQAIMESGTESNFWSINYPEAEPESFIWQVAAQLNCSDSDDDFEMIDCLRELPWRDIRSTRFDCTPGHFCQGMGPVVDGPGGFLPELPEELRASGNFMQGPIITGITRDDGSFYTSGLIPESFDGGFNRSEFQFYMRDRLLAIWTPILDNATDENYFQAVDFNYSPWPYVEDEYNNRDAFNEMITDAAFGHQWNNQLNNHHPFATTYGYIYDYRGRNATMVFPEWMGVPHMGELPQTWGWPLIPFNPAVRNDSGIIIDIIDWTEEDVAQCIYWQTMYANFAHTGNPTPVPVEDPLGGVTDWRPFSTEDMAYLYVGNETVEVQTQYRQKYFAFWREYMTYLYGDFPIPIGGLDGISHTRPHRSYPGAVPIPSDWLDNFYEYFALLMDGSIEILEYF